jgi:sulfate transport system ATP-binding protein
LQLSGGQRQRVALARALAVEPRVLLLDEPFGALDAKVRKDLRRWLRDIHERTGQTTIFVTHDQDEALELADRVAILNDGRLEQVGAPEVVYDQPASPFVMSFVGETTRVPVIVRSGEAWLGGKPIGVIVRGVEDGPTDLFVRPWDLSIGPPDPTRLNGTVKTMRRSGQKNRISVLLQDTDISLDVDTPLDSPARIGDVVALRILRGRAFAEPGSGRKNE